MIVLASSKRDNWPRYVANEKFDAPPFTVTKKLGVRQTLLTDASDNCINFAIFNIYEGYYFV